MTTSAGEQGTQGSESAGGTPHSLVPLADSNKSPAPPKPGLSVEDSDILLLGGETNDFELTLDDPDPDDEHKPLNLSSNSRSLPDAASDFDFSLASSGIRLDPGGDDDDDDDPLDAMSVLPAGHGGFGDTSEWEVRAYRLPHSSRAPHAGSADPHNAQATPPVGDPGSMLQRVLRSLSPAEQNSTVEVIGDMAVVSTTSDLHEKLANVLIQLTRSLQQRPTFQVKAYWIWLNHHDRDTIASQSTSQPLQALLSRADESGSPVFQASLTCCDGHAGRLAAAVIQESASATAKPMSVRLDVTPVSQPDDDRGVLLCLKTRLGPGALDAQLDATCCLRLGQDTLIGTFPTPTRKSPSGSMSLCLIVRLESAN